jgi:hypothetical protein
LVAFDLSQDAPDEIEPGDGEQKAEQKAEQKWH